MRIVPDHEVCQELSRSERFVLYRGRRRKDRSAVLLKMPCSHSASTITVRLLEHESNLLNGLSLPQSIHRSNCVCCQVRQAGNGTMVAPVVRPCGPRPPGGVTI